MDNPQLGPASPPGQSAAPGRSGQAKRVVTTIAASAFLLGSGAAIGVAVTAGASAAAATPRGAAGPLAGRCTKIVQKLRSRWHEVDHPQAKVKLSSGEKVLVIGLVTDAGKDARLIQVRQAS